MRIAIQAADLDHDRIDGTRVYLFNLLKHFGKLDKRGEFLIYHRGKFNPEIAPASFLNYKIIRKKFPFFWTQTVFAWSLLWKKPDVLWMPMASLPYLRRKKMRVAVTIHDLAFKYFPEYFTTEDLRKLNFLADLAVRKSDKIIAISEATKKDILKFYPEITEEKIKVIYHGFSADVFASPRDLEKENETKKNLGIKGDYILYSGAIQPRKNLEALIEAFELFKTETGSPIKLVLAGEKAWLWESIEKMAEQSLFNRDIIMPGRVKFCDVGHLFRGASIYVYPSLYEGFGITILEAFAAGIPLIAASNSSLQEIGGDGALYFDALDPQDLSEKIRQVMRDENLCKDLVAKGKERIKEFSWEKCARETLDYLKTP